MKLFSNITFSKNNFDASRDYVSVDFKNCRFENINLSEITFTSCDFIDCFFKNCNFKNAFLAQNIGENSGKFSNCTFTQCNFFATNFKFPIIENCFFDNNLLNETNFDGSRFCDTKFTGTLDSCFFRGHSIDAKDHTIFTFKRIDFKKIRNLMKNVDFSQSKLVGNTFSDNIDLSQCIFPVGNEYVYVKDLKNTMNNATSIIQTEWEPTRRREIALLMIDKFYYRKDFQDQKANFYDAFIANEVDVREGNSDSMDLFNLIKSLS